MFTCLNAGKFNMVATVLTQGPTEPDVEGHWVDRQNPDTGEIERVWVVDDSDPSEAGTQARTIKCMVRGVIDGGIRVAGTTERYTPQGVYDNVDYAKMNVGPNEKISKRDRITNVRNDKGVLLWKEEEFDGAPTVFEVLGVTPVPDPFGTPIEQIVLLKRAEVQQYGTG